MEVIVGPHDYGKSGIRLLVVDRANPTHNLREVCASVVFQGDFTSAYSGGDNSSILPTGSMLNTVFATAVDQLGNSMEDLARFSAVRLLDSCPAAEIVTVELTETAWERLGKSGSPDPFNFRESQNSSSSVTAKIRRGERMVITIGMSNLRLLKTTGSQFTGFLRGGDFTNLADVEDRLAAFIFDVGWEFHPEAGKLIDYGACGTAAYSATLDAFSRHISLSGQHTCFELGAAALQAVPELRRVHLSILGEDILAVDLQPFGRTNPGLLYTVSRDPHSRGHLTVERPEIGASVN
ncbi:factor-independent urate hydroxylase [Streptomyces sp. NPDC127051]|uniref:factor-independent urate hydroxylase n=1 Tax=Streptomyces sp. NPDC127051 TaxID=3347119 RepID=UPI003658625D